MTVPIVRGIFTLLFCVGLSASISFEDCPVNCTCTDPVTYCDGDSFITVPESSVYVFIGSTNVTSILNTSFHNVVNITSLYITYNDIYHIQPGSFDNNVKLTVLSLSSNQISDLPENLFQNLQVLRTLYLQSNSIRNVSTLTFSGLGMVSTLNLKGNNIDYIENGVFQNMTSLRTLDLSRNFLKNIENEVFVGLGALTTLNLDFNPIDGGILRDTLFTHLAKLGTLTIDGIGLEKVDDTLFCTIPDLSTLRMSENLVLRIPVLAFQCLTNLKFLELRNNPVTLLSGDFMSLVNLTDLLMSELPMLDALPDGVFSGLSSLTILRLENNKQLETIGPNVFTNEDLPKLEYLFLTNNSFSVVDPSVFAGVSNSLIYLRDNPFNCDCDLIPFVESLMTSTLAVSSKENLLCVAPDNLRDKQLALLPLGAFTCNVSSVVKEPPKLNSLYDGEPFSAEASFDGGVPSVVWIANTENGIFTFEYKAIARDFVEPGFGNVVLEETITDSGIVNAKLTLPSVNSDMSGSYQAVASNAGGVRIIFFVLLVNPATTTPLPTTVPPSTTLNSTGNATVAEVNEPPWRHLTITLGTLLALFVIVMLFCFVYLQTKQKRSKENKNVEMQTKF